MALNGDERKALAERLVVVFPQSEDLRAWLNVSFQLGPDLPGNFAPPNLIAYTAVEALAHRGRDGELGALLDALPAATLAAVLQPTRAVLPTRRAPSPSQLLQAAFEVVPFWGRTAELANLAAWCGEEAAVGVWLWTGAGGSGKTRLMVEACNRQRAAGWEAGFLETSLPANALTPLLRSPRDRLVVLDYAETRRDFLAALLAALVRGPIEGKLRLVLLARAQSDWWQELHRQDRLVGNLLSEGPEPVNLTPLFPTPEERPERFGEAAAAFAEKLRKPLPAPLPQPDLRSEPFEQALFLSMASLAAIEGRSLTNAQDLLDETLAHEQRFWQRRAVEEHVWKRSWNRAREQLEKVVTAVTLLGGLANSSQVRPLVASVAEIAGEESTDVAELLRDLYPRWEEGQPRGVSALFPDLLGEHLVGRALTPELLAEVLEERWEGAASVLTVLTRLAQREPKHRKWLVAALDGRVERLARVAMEVAIQTGDPLGLVLAEYLEANPQSHLACKLVDECPEQTLALREAAVVLTQQALLAVSPEGVEERARLLIKLGRRLSELGQREAALETAQEGVGLYRRLATARPDVFLPDLALSLNGLCFQLSELGQREAALETIQEAVSIRRRLAVVRPDSFLPDLAASLTNLGGRLGDLGQREAALEATQEAVNLYRCLASAHPNTFLLNLASSLTNLGNFLGDLGQREAALDAAQEGAKLYRRLVAARPDAFLSFLANSLTNLGTHLSRVDQREAALEATQEAVNLYRRLASARSDAFLPDLALSLSNLGNHLNVVGQRNSALESAQEAVDLFRRLASTHPNVFLPDLARSLTNLGVFLGELGQQEAALESAQEAVNLYRRLASARPDASLPYLALSLDNLGIRLSAVGQREAALDASQEALDLYRYLAATRPRVFSGPLAQTLNHLGDLLRDLEQPEAAWMAYTEAVSLYRPWFLENPPACVQRMGNMVDDYLKYIPPNQQPDEDLLAPIREALQGLACEAEE